MLRHSPQKKTIAGLSRGIGVQNINETKIVIQIQKLNKERERERVQQRLNVLAIKMYELYK